MSFKFLSLLAFALYGCATVKRLSASQVKAKIDSVYYSPSSDLLPPELNVRALENQYYCDSVKNNGHVFVLRLRDNSACICETYYKPYNWVRISYRIGNYKFSGDTIQIVYKSLLEGERGKRYLRPVWHVSWIPPDPPDYLLLDKGNLFDPASQRRFYRLTDSLRFELESTKRL